MVIGSTSVRRAYSWARSRDGKPPPSPRTVPRGLVADFEPAADLVLEKIGCVAVRQRIFRIVCRKPDKKGQAAEPNFIEKLEIRGDGRDRLFAHDGVGQLAHH